MAMTEQTLSRPPVRRRPAGPTRTAPSVEVVVPVFNEEAALERSVRRLHRYLSAELPFSWRIVIADNASTDATPAIARALAHELPGVELLRIDRKGRGRALREAWSRSDAKVLCYMDVDLSTDLRALLPLVAPLLSGHSDLAIGTRLARSARVVRGPKRELISRGYNRLLHTVLRARFSDAQCGFKAVTATAAGRLLDDVHDDGWFFDTELLVLAQRRGLRIHEVPVDWVDDPDSRVDIVRTAIEDLRGVARLAAAGPVVRFMGVGVLSTIAYVVLYLLLHGALGAGRGERRRPGHHRGGQHRRQPPADLRRARARRARRHHARGAVVYVLTLGLTSLALASLHRLDPAPSRAVELAVLVVAGAAATITRYVALRTWVFARARAAGTAAVEASC